jgi:hypothetical protein
LAGRQANWTSKEITNRQKKLADLSVQAWPRSV